MENALGDDACYRALLARDPRFDGLFFTGVSTTGVYCRPVCPARTPRRDRCTFHRTAAEAERAGFRACFRCRPELAPSARRERPPLVARAVARVEAAATSGESLESVAASLGVSSRHLRREIERHTGVTPVELVQTQRLALAKRLLQDTALPVTEIAFASGWQSLRRFHAAFGARFGCPPGEVRRGASRVAPGLLRLRLDHRPPLAWEELLGFLRARAVAGVEVVDVDYRRVIRTRGGLGVLTVRRDPERPALWAELPADAAPDVVAWIARLRRLFDLDARPDVVDALLARDALFRRSVRARPGVRVPGALDPFEAAVRVVLGQLVSVEAARRLAGRLVERFGEPLAAPADGLSRAFPTAARVAALDVGALASLGLPARRAEAVRAVAAAFAAEPLEEALSRLEGAPGIGPWTREVLAMRLGAPDAFPATDLGVRRALGAPGEARARAEAWRPYRAYGVMRLWLEGER